jgi:spermidine/putrescine transport system ATP-binding protein
MTTTSTPILLECRGLRKAYKGDDAFVLGARAGISFHVASGELVALLGGSGSGKTTTLRLIGGFLPADDGNVIISGTDVTFWPPYRRPTNTVFQNLALFPHLSVAGNVGFGLAVDRVHRHERRTRVSNALDLVGLVGFENRRVSELSGGQQQRAALARALIRRPAVLLLDEPLGSLDLALRKQMQDELVRLKALTPTAFVHVTHDQQEACAIADRVAVMKDGDIVQIDEPFALYSRPRTTYVARLLDAGTIVQGRNVRHGDVMEVQGRAFTVRAAADGSGSHRRAAVLPAEKVRVVPAQSSGRGNEIIGTVTRLVFTGTSFLVYTLVNGDVEVRASLTIEQLHGAGDAMAIGASVQISWDASDVLLVDDSDEPEMPD